MLLNFTSFFRRYQYNSYAANIYPLRQYRLNSYAAIHPKGVIKITTTVLIFYITDYWCNRYATQFAITKTDAVWIASFPHMYASHTFSLEGLKHWQLCLSASLTTTLYKAISVKLERLGVSVNNDRSMK